MAAAVLAASLVVPQPLLDRYLDQRGWSLDALHEGRYVTQAGSRQRPLTLADVQRYLINSDPVLWAERNLVERTTGGRTLWRLWDYQQQSLRWMGDAHFKCGAEVGKTREIVARHLWLGKVWGRDGLIGAAMDGHLESIWDEMLYQLETVPQLRAGVDWDGTLKKPYRKIRWRNGALLHLRTAGLTGAAFRGLHVLDASMDEAALISTEQPWNEWHRAVKPYGTRRGYSTPNGNRASEFSRFCRQSLPAEKYFSVRPKALDPLALPKPGRGPQGVELLFRWSKESMPPPFWTPERRRMYIRQYGGEDSAGYQQNVLGKDGDLFGSVFPYDRFVACCGYIPEYRHLELRYDGGQYWLSVHALNPDYNLAADTEGGETRHQESVRLLDDELLEVDDVSSESWAAIVDPYLPRPTGRTVGGADVGWSHDPTEIGLHEISDQVRWTWRLTIRGVDSPVVQRCIFCGVDLVARPSAGWGLDATRRGASLEHELRNAAPASHEFSHRLSGYALGDTVDARDPVTGQVLRDTVAGKPRRITLKEQGVQIQERRVQEGGYVMPMDSEIVHEWTSFQAKPGKKGGRVFVDGHDHTVAEGLVAELRWFHGRFGTDSAPPPVPVQGAAVPGRRKLGSRSPLKGRGRASGW